MKKVTCLFFMTEAGRVPVKDFVEATDLRSQRKFFYVVELLEHFGMQLDLPHARYIGDDIFELRFESVEGAVRVLYFFFHRETAILTNAFVKKTDKTPFREKEVALERRKVYLERHR